MPPNRGVIAGKKAAEEERSKDALTRKLYAPKVGLLYLAHICREYSRIRVERRNREEAQVCFFGLRYSIRSPMGHLSSHPVQPPDMRRPIEAFETGVCEFPDLRANSMNKNKRKQAGVSYQGERNLSAFACFSRPRHEATSFEQRREWALSRRIRYGIMRATEGLRGVRLSLVPGPELRDCLLQGV